MSSADPSIHRHEIPLAPAVPICSPGDDFDPVLEARAVAIVQEFFPGPIEIEEMFDPSEPERKWRVIVANATGTKEETRAAEAAWRKRVIREFTPDEIWRYTLLVAPKAE